MDIVKRTRFAPSPTGYLHTGNAYSALWCAQWAKKHHAELVLRIEDIDFNRCRPEFATQILDDLAWLGISFEGEVVYQQQRLHFYQQALDKLMQLDVLYPCFCSRKKIREAHEQGASNSKLKLDHYPYTCRHLTLTQREKMGDTPFSWRLNQDKVVSLLGQTLFWTNSDGQKSMFDITSLGDVVIGRKDITFSYHLSVVVDDFLQGITHIIRGEDLLESTAIHIILQRLLAYSHPVYQHHPLLTDETGQRLAKSKQSISLKALRESGIAAADIFSQ
ncbi:MAG: tRNA glutamyl-Q(34) synthetase GluQRS [Mariprofundaceae bacterium]|nr:tRNA glutamyl-Q(34) synthetase GluQRS [Mariprofundaceae bacterium]